MLNWLRAVIYKRFAKVVTPEGATHLHKINELYYKIDPADSTNVLCSCEAGYWSDSCFEPKQLSTDDFKRLK